MRRIVEKSSTIRNFSSGRSIDHSGLSSIPVRRGGRMAFMSLLRRLRFGLCGRGSGSVLRLARFRRVAADAVAQDPLFRLAVQNDDADAAIDRIERIRLVEHRRLAEAG